MNWDQFKAEVDEAIIDKLGAGFNSGDIEIDYIDVGSYSVTDIEIVKDNDCHVLRVT